MHEEHRGSHTGVDCFRKTRQNNLEIGDANAKNKFKQTELVWSTLFLRLRKQTHEGAGAHGKG